MELIESAGNSGQKDESNDLARVPAKLSSSGFTLIPQPSDDSKDPLVRPRIFHSTFICQTSLLKPHNFQNWSSLKKSTTLFIWCLAAFVTTASGLGNTLGYFVQAKIYNKPNPISLSYSVRRPIDIKLSLLLI